MHSLSQGDVVRYSIQLALAAMALFVGTEAGRAQATQPTASPAAVPTTSPAAQAMLDQLKNSYAKLNSLELGGTFALDADAGGQQQHKSAEFTASFQAPTKFRHEMKDDVTVIDTGEKVIAYLPSRNQYSSADAPKERTADLPNDIADLLHEQNPSLCLALASDAAAELVEGALSVEKAPDAQLDGQTFPTLKLAQDDRDVLVLIDPKSGLLRQMQIDLRRMLEKEQVPQIKSAQITINYSKTSPGASTDAQQFAFTPPAGAQQVKPDVLAAAPDADAGPADQLVGKPAIGFKLENTEGKEVSPTTEFKGKVIVLDFWATWCPPCVAGLPHLDELFKEKQKDGVEVFAVNQNEDKDKVQRFVDQHKLTVHVLLDSNGEVGGKYFVSGIPQTVVIGRDGKVASVFVGYGDEQGQKINEAVDAALKAK
jgi:peroxiredoxin/outer membrane lipoprotein-sorting protein